MISSQTDELSRKRVILSNLNEQQGWGLTHDDQARYLNHLNHLLINNASDQLLETIFTNYHDDHRMVEKLRIEQEFDRDDWNEWLQNVYGALAKCGLDWSSQSASTREDLVQIALVGLLSALPTYGYRSHFKTWAYTVFLRSVLQHWRRSQAIKRKGSTVSLDKSQIDDKDSPQLTDSKAIDPVDETFGTALQTLIYTILAEQPDQRLAAIFRLAEEEDRTVTEIGRLFKLSPARISDLLKKAKQVLKADPRIRDWYNPDHSIADESATQ